MPKVKKIERAFPMKKLLWRNSAARTVSCAAVLAVSVGSIQENSTWIVGTDFASTDWRKRTESAADMIELSVVVVAVRVLRLGSE